MTCPPRLPFLERTRVNVMLQPGYHCILKCGSYTNSTEEFRLTVVNYYTEINYPFPGAASSSSLCLGPCSLKILKIPRIVW